MYKQVTTDEIKEMPKEDPNGITNHLFHRDNRYFQVLQLLHNHLGFYALPLNLINEYFRYKSSE